MNLERETTPLRVLPSCPRNFKRTSVERYFREKGFAIDWCAFRLMTLDNQLSSEDTTAIYKELETTDNDDNEPEQVIFNFDKPKKKSCGLSWIRTPTSMVKGYLRVPY